VATPGRAAGEGTAMASGQARRGPRRGLPVPLAGSWQMVGRDGKG